MTTKLEEQIFAALDGTIEPDEFANLQRAIEHDADARRLYLQCVDLYESLAELNLTTGVAGQSNPIEPRFINHIAWLSIAATIMLVCSVAAFNLGRRSSSDHIEYDNLAQTPSIIQKPMARETMVAGHASLRRALNVRWEKDSIAYQSGDLIPAGVIRIGDGVLEMDFFCGASLVVEGPAELEIQSDWELTCRSGRLRANVPPAARGFVINAAESKIVDLGTEFSLQVTEDTARVEVIDGEVEIQQTSEAPQRLTTGEEKWLGRRSDSEVDASQIASPKELENRQSAQQQLRLSSWQAASRILAQDNRLVAYYPIELEPSDDLGSTRRVVNAAQSGESGDGVLVGSVANATGRFGEASRGLEFDRPGARVRVRLDGTYDAFTFIAWVKIDSLQRAYNALFMADSYENGEPHWQIDNAGRMMFSVMVDENAEVEYYSPVEEAIVLDAGRHRVYRTPVIWDLSKSGRWMQLAAVYDPNTTRVRQYVDGEKVSDDEINQDFLVKQLHIGAAEIGNWGQPFRKTPSFAVRNLDGTIDELAIYNAALSDEEIEQLYRSGKP